jgi:hypothetical protein
MLTLKVYQVTQMSLEGPYYEQSGYIGFVGFEVFTAAAMKSSVFWDTMPRSLLKAELCLPPAFTLVSCLTYVFFDPKDGGDMFLQNIG